ncbi:EAL domain-containing protein [Granulosicoccus antarcticus]|uniref:Cyclic di-GMP phosphodiesterase PdeB n=1 Tax=Granulosicoccus antarcticus IMCC3135 TaxID=1192854 RepID=A0A2Z2NVU8_9GAMM|nr:EAL domain-containing protein [Granulosicoccus antarcticus]ASJ75469.1 Cyclic di-GMP phosphodiesterase PdeB [Granulosicoccus antarcticus IMCC3135]
MRSQAFNPRTLRWIKVALCGALLIPALLLTAHSINGLQQKEIAAERMRTAAYEISEKVGGIRTLMASLVGLYQASGQLDDQALMLFSKQIMEHADHVTSIARYEHIINSERRQFEKNLSETGIFNFEIGHMDSLGKRTIRRSAYQYHPITMLEPLRPDNARLIGADLASLEGLGKTLDFIARRNESLLTTFPDAWPYGRQMVFFRPVYLGQQIPATESERRRQAAGGFWITVDVEKFLGKIADRLSDFDISVQITQGDSTRLLFEQKAEVASPLYLRSLYPRQQFVEKWESDTSTLIISYQTQIGYSGYILCLSLASIMALMLVISQLYAQRRQRLIREQERQNDHDALFEIREMAEKTLNAVQDAIITLDADLCVSHINPAAVIQFNAKPSATIGKPLDQVVRFQMADERESLFDLEAALQNLSHNSRGEFDIVPIGHSHADFILNLTLSSSRNPNGDASGHVMVMRNVSQEYRLTAKLAYQANHDALTGCSNRYHFEQTLAGLIDELPFNDCQHALCYIDLDQFKVVNDSCGHRAGDRLLAELSEQLRPLVRNEDILSRLGGDEFGLLMIDVSPELANQIANRLFEFFQTHTFRHENKVFAVRACISVVQIDSDCDNMKDVLAAADIACFTAKDSGRNRLNVYSTTDVAINERSAELSWLPRLQNALQNDDFMLYLQPVASIALLADDPTVASSIQHFEFLLRMKGPGGEVLAPWQFIRAAERYDLMRQVDRWVIRNSLRTVAELKGGPGGTCSYSINLSGQSAADPTLKTFIQEQYDNYQITPSQIWFELTETAAISHISVANELFQSIRAMGSLIALDDFGSGLSSLGYLKNMPIDIIKIDGQFVREIAKNKIDRQMVLSIQQLGNVMGIKTVAEYVEDQDILDELIKIGIDYAQGYRIGEPAPVATSLRDIFGDQRAA